MAKFANYEITFEVKEMKIHVKGDREIAPSIATNAGRQFASMLSAAAVIEAPKNGHADGAKVIEAQVPPPRNRRKKSARASADPIGAAALAWSHDTNRWGSPIQNWKTLQKSAWLLTVVGEALGKHDLSAGEITDIFKSNFRDAGPPRPSNIARDLGKETSLFGEENGRFFLKQEGKDLGTKLVEEARGQAAAA